MNKSKKTTIQPTYEGKYYRLMVLICEEYEKVGTKPPAPPIREIDRFFGKILEIHEMLTKDIQQYQHETIEDIRKKLYGQKY